MDNEPANPEAKVEKIVVLNAPLPKVQHKGSPAKEKPLELSERIEKYQKRIEAIRKQRELSATELEACNGNEKLHAELVAKKALGYQDLIKSVESLQDAIGKNRCHKSCNVFNQPFARSASSGKPINKAQKTSFTHLDTQTTELQRIKKQQNIIACLANNGSMSSRLLGDLPKICTSPRLEKVNPGIKRARRTQNAIWNTMKKPIFPSVASAMLINNPIGFRKKRNFSIGVDTGTELIEKVETEGGTVKYGTEVYMDPYPLSARNSGRTSIIKNKRIKSIIRGANKQRISLGTFDFPLASRKHEV